MSSNLPMNSDLQRQLAGEHLELVYLFIHEDQMAWRLSLGYLAANLTLVLLLTQFPNTPSLPPWLWLRLEYAIYLAGIIVNVQGVFIMERSRIHRQARLARAYEIEDALKASAAPLCTFDGAERRIAKGEVLRLEAGESPNLRWYERVEALATHRIGIVLAVGWLYFLVRRNDVLFDTPTGRVVSIAAPLGVLVIYYLFGIIRGRPAA